MRYCLENELKEDNKVKLKIDRKKEIPEEKTIKGEEKNCFRNRI